MTRDELLKDIETEVRKVLPDDVELSDQGEEGESYLTSMRDCVDEVFDNAEAAIGDSEEEDIVEDDSPTSTK